MSSTKILTIVFGVISVLLTWYLYHSIDSSIEEQREIKRKEKRIIRQLEMIREAELAYKAVNGRYTSDWDKLLSFIDTGRFYITERKETIITLEYGADSTYVEIDTLGTIGVRDSIFKETIYPQFDLATFAYVPGVEPPVRFDLWADKIEKSGVLVDVIEVKNPKPINPERDEESEFNTKKPLRFGSRTSVTTSGNWE